ncbi:MAG: DUF1801 domain-containing protein [Caldilineaceae bacterium]
MAELKTKPNDGDVEAFLATVPDAQRRSDSLVLLDLFRAVTGEPAKMWGTAIVGFGDSHYAYASGREGDWFVTGFSPRKQNLTLYCMGGYAPHGEVLARLGKHKLGKGCLYINRLQDVDLDVLRELITTTVAAAQRDTSA